jgi:hypothetical protein
MKIREGAYYRTRDGDVVGPMRLRKDQSWYSSYHQWNEDGGIFSSGADHGLDLISEVYVSDTPHAAGQNTFQNCTVGTYAPETKTLRDEFAMTVMGSLLYNRGETGTFSDYAQDAYEYADCMMEARKK